MNQTKIIIIFFAFIFIAGWFLLTPKHLQPGTEAINQTPANSAIINQTVTSSSPASIIKTPELAEPLDSALSRVAKKPFGLYVTPKNSPVSPEKFSGYHTGVDFEILPGEETLDVPVRAVCGGKLLLKKSVSGYGGVAVESCELADQQVTIIYGHLELTSINHEIGQAVAAGETIGLLGRGYSDETDGERKHLHLAVHKDAAVNLLGYVQDKKLLDGWINALDYMK
jgi:murein DD-endopeptidase MepM/ murein hydrolase activator NlpD